MLYKKGKSPVEEFEMKRSNTFDVKFSMKIGDPSSI